LADFPDEIVKGMKIHLVGHMDEVISFSVLGGFCDSMEANTLKKHSHIMDGTEAAH
jgi:hypothetical protein